MQERAVWSRHVTAGARLAGDRGVDVAVVLACLALTAFAVKTPWSPLPGPVVATAGVLASAAMWPRRRAPLVAAVAGSIGFALAGNPGTVLVGLYTGARYAPRRKVWLCGVAACAGYVGWSWLDRQRLLWDDFVFAPLGVGLVILVGMYLATRDALLDASREQTRRGEADRSMREEQARAAERTRIAREMHDVLAHKVSLIALYAGALELHAGTDTRLKEGTALIRVTAREALAELRDVLGVLRTTADQSPTSDGSASVEPVDYRLADLTALVDASAHAGHPVELHESAGPLPAATARVVYRVVQEGLTNAHKHAPDALTTVTVARADDGGVTVTVHNDLGATPLDLPGSGVGLVGLAERIRLVGGSLHAGPVTGEGGWQLRAVVPWLDSGAAGMQAVDARAAASPRPADAGAS
ncbi:sensor histidine kinase [Micromonospora carbonacea]